MTARQIIQEIETLPPAERREVLLHLKEKDAEYSSSVAPVRYLDRAAARPMIKEILTEHAELFRKLAQ